MEIVKRRVFRKHEPYITRDLKRYMDWKINGYIDYLDKIDPDRLYTLEYDTDVPTKEELLNGIDQHYVQTYNSHSRKDEKEKEEKDNNTDWFFNGEIVLQDEEEIKETVEESKETIKSGSLIEQLAFNAKLDKERKKELRAKSRQEEKEARERRIERKKAKEEQEELRRQKENSELKVQQLQRADRGYVDRFFQEYGREGLSHLFQDSAYHIGRLNLQIAKSDVIIENDVELLEAYKYRQDYVKKLTQEEREKGENGEC